MVSLYVSYITTSALSLVDFPIPQLGKLLSEYHDERFRPIVGIGHEPNKLDMHDSNRDSGSIRYNVEHDHYTRGKQVDDGILNQSELRLYSKL